MITSRYPEINDLVTHLRTRLTTADGGHDFWHAYAVWRNALTIARGEGIDDTLVIELAALTHDLGDSKFHKGDETVGPAVIREFLSEQGFSDEVTTAVVEISEAMSFKKNLHGEQAGDSALQIVKDADRLEAIGAIGIARAFVFAGYIGEAIYDPTKDVRAELSLKEYKDKTSGTCINHFHEKLLLLKDRMHTATARQLAEGRHQHMLGFLEQFHREWEGKA